MAVSRPPSREHTSGGPGGPRGPKRQHRKVCAFCAEKIEYIDYKEISRLRPLTMALERARAIALLPYTTESH